MNVTITTLYTLRGWITDARNSPAPVAPLLIEGPIGSGKSTLLRFLTCMASPAHTLKDIEVLHTFGERPELDIAKVAQSQPVLAFDDIGIAEISSIIATGEVKYRALFKDNYDRLNLRNHRIILARSREHRPEDELFPVIKSRFVRVELQAIRDMVPEAQAIQLYKDLLTQDLQFV